MLNLYQVSFHIGGGGYTGQRGGWECDDVAKQRGRSDITCIEIISTKAGVLDYD